MPVRKSPRNFHVEGRGTRLSNQSATGGPTNGRDGGSPSPSPNLLRWAGSVVVTHQHNRLHHPETSLLCTSSLEADPCSQRPRHAVSSRGGESIEGALTVVYQEWVHALKVYVHCKLCNIRPCYKLTPYFNLRAELSHRRRQGGICPHRFFTL